MKKSVLKSPAASRQPSQSRSRETVRAIVDACHKIMLEEGSEAVTTNHIAEVAGVNIASLYRWFPNKEAVISEIFEAQIEREIHEVVGLYEAFEARGGRDVFEALELVVEPLINRQIRFLSLHACFYRDQRPKLDVGRRKFGGREKTLIDEAAHWLAGLVSQRCPAMSVAAAELVAFHCVHSAAGICQAAVDRPELLHSADFRDELYFMLRSYLRARMSSA